MAGGGRGSTSIARREAVEEGSVQKSREKKLRRKNVRGSRKMKRSQSEIDPTQILQHDWMVRTPYGPARVAQVRFADGLLYYDLDLIGWKSTMTTCRRYPSIEPRVGSEVVVTDWLRRLEPNGAYCQELQHGRVIEVRPEQRQAVVRLVSWQLMQQTSNRGSAPSFVTCTLSYSGIQVLAPKPMKRMSVYEKVLYVHERKTMALQLYAKREWKAALEFFEQTLPAIRSLLYRHTASVRTVRANLILTKIKCCNLASTCCWNLEDWTGVAQHSLHALRLLHTLEVKGRLHDSEDPSLVKTNELEEGEVRVFGSWRVKALSILSQALMKMKEWEPAKQVLQQAHKIVLKYTKELQGTSRRSRDQKKRLKQLYRANRNLLRLYARVETKLTNAARNPKPKRKPRTIVVVETKSTSDASDSGSVVSVLSHTSFADGDGGVDDGDECANEDENDDWPPLCSLIPSSDEVAKADTTESTAEASREEEDDDDDDVPYRAGEVARLTGIFSANATPLKVSSVSYPGTTLEAQPLARLSAKKVRIMIDC